MILAALCLALLLPRADEQLAPGKPARVELRARESWSRRFVLDVPADSIAVRLVVSAATVELGLHADWQELPEDTQDTSYSAHTDGGEAQLSIDRFSAHPLRRGKLYLELGWEGEGAPETSERRLETIGCTLEARVFAAGVDGEVQTGQWVEGAIAPRASGTRTFRVECPKGEHELRIDLDRVQGDLDLYARAGKPVGAIDAGVQFARHLWGRETLLVGEGVWFVDVVDVTEEEAPVGFRIGAHLGAAVPPELAALPALPASFPGPLGRALPCVVELFGQESTGSGTLLSPAGWILTNAHVVTAMGGGREPEIVVACTLDPHDPPLELFRAAVREFDAERDLALLQVTQGFYGQALPEGLRFPAIALGDPAALAIGDTLLLAGYPSTSAMGSLMTLHVTRGIVAGFDHAAPGMVLKTDAGITGGNSGGAALDERGALVGIPTRMIESSSGQAGFVHPWTWMPESWRARVAAGAKR